MAVALFGASALALQHKEHVISFLGRSREQVAAALTWDALPTVSAAMFLVFYAELSFRSRNLLSRNHHRDLGLYLVKAGFIAAAVYLLLYRCHQECDTHTFQGFEQHFYKVRWYLRLFAAAAATHSILASAVLGTVGLLFQGEGVDPEDSGPALMLGVIPDSIADALGVKQRIKEMKGGSSSALVAAINGILMPLLLVYGLWALWLPQLPLLAQLRSLPFDWAQTSDTSEL